MVPKTEIIYNYDYAKRLYRGGENFEDVWHRIIGIGEDFERIYEEYADFLLASVEKYTGFVWEERTPDFLPVYMADCESSFWQPLTLTVDKNSTAMLEDFIYQLVHQNMSFGFINEEERKKCYSLVTDRIMSDLGLKKQKNAEWNLTKKTIKEYLNK